MIRYICLKNCTIQNLFNIKPNIIRNFSVTQRANDELDEKDIASASQQTQIPVRPPLPLYTSRKLAFPPKFKPPMQAWVCNLDTIEEEKLGIIDLHPEIFAAYPRLDVIHKNVVWQQMYRRINWAVAKTRAEVRGGGKKPWPQKGSGRARHGSIRAPQWRGGGKAHGPRGPKTYFYMLSFPLRIQGLTATISAKLAQDDIKIVDSLDIPTDEPEFLENLIEQRHWGLSVLFVDDTDIMPRNISIATEKFPQFNIMPVYGLNVYSMLKHDTLVLTLAAVEKIEQRLLYNMNRIDWHHVNQPFMMSRLPYSPLTFEHLLPKVDSY